MAPKETAVLGPENGKFMFKKHPDGSVDKRAVVCQLCNKEFVYHRNSSSLYYHLKAKHAANVEARAKANVPSASKVWVCCSCEVTLKC